MTINNAKYKINQVIVLKSGIGLRWKIENMITDTKDTIIKYKITRHETSKIVNEDDISFSIKRRR